MGNFFRIFFTPVVYIQNDRRVMGIILRYVCWGTHQPPPPPGSPAADHQFLAQPCLSFGFARRVVCVCACVCAVSLCTCRAFLLVASRP